MRRLLTALTAISLVGTLFIGTPAPAYATNIGTDIVSARVTSADDNIVHAADDLEDNGQYQLYLADPGQQVGLALELTARDFDADNGIEDSFTLTLNNGSFGSNFTDNRVAVPGNCAIAWTNTSTTVRSGVIDCDDDQPNIHVINVIFYVTTPDAGSAVLTVTGAGSTFKVYFMAAQNADRIYVGQDADMASGAGSCGAAGPDFSTTNTTQDLDVQQAIDFALQSIDQVTDTVIICDGYYEYTDSIREYYGYDLYSETLTVEAEHAGEVTLDGNSDFGLLNVNAADLSVEGIYFYDGQAYNGGAIYVANDYVEGDLVGGSLTVLDSDFYSNEAVGEFFGSGGAIYVEGSLTVNDSSFEDSSAVLYGGAIYVYGADYEAEQTVIADSWFSDNYADDEGGAIAIVDSQMAVTRSYFENNSAYYAGGAIYTYDTNWSVSHSTFGNPDDNHISPELENHAAEGGDIYSGTGTIEAPVTGTITHSSFYDSRATGLEGGGDGASLYMECTALNLNNSLFHSTEANEDAVLFLRDDDECTDYRATVSRTTFTDNHAYSDGVIFVDAGDEYEGISGLLSLTVTNSLFTGNVAEEDEGVFDVEGPVDISIINSRFERNSAGDNGAVIEMDGGDDNEEGTTSNGSLVFSRNQVRFNSAGTQSDVEDGDYAEGDGMIQLDDVTSWQIDYNTFQGNTADRGAVLAFEVDVDDLRDLVQLNGFRRNTIIGHSASVGGSYLFIQYNDNASNVNRASIKRIEQQVKKNRNVIKGGTRPQILQLLDFLSPPPF